MVHLRNFFLANQTCENYEDMSVELLLDVEKHKENQWIVVQFSCFNYLLTILVLANSMDNIIHQ